MSHIQLYEQGEMDYGTDNFPSNATELKLAKRNKPSHARRRGRAPQSINGIHRRRTQAGLVVRDAIVRRSKRAAPRRFLRFSFKLSVLFLRAMPI